MAKAGKAFSPAGLGQHQSTRITRRQERSATARKLVSWMPKLQEFEYDRITDGELDDQVKRLILERNLKNDA